MHVLAFVALLPFAIALMVAIGVFVWVRLRTRALFRRSREDDAIESEFVDDASNAPEP